MKVYVDELPKHCKDCNCMNRVNGRCQLLHLYVDEDEKQEDCPLESIADHDKKVRAEVVAEIKSALREKVVKMQGNTHCYPENAICWEDVVAVLRCLGVKNEINWKNQRWHLFC